MSKKVLQLCLSSSWGGLEMSAATYARHLNSKSVESLCLTLKDSPLALKSESFGIKILTLNEQLNWLSKVKTVRQFIKSHNITTVFVHRLKDLQLLYPALIGMNEVSVVGFAHMLLNVSKRDPLHKLLYSRLKTLVTFTARQKNLLLPKLPLAESRYSVAYPGVDSQKFHPEKRDENLRLSLNVTRNDCLLGVIGRFDRQKGQLEFVQALKLLHDRNIPFKAVLVGAPTAGENQNDYEKEIFDFVASNGLESKVKFVGFLDDPSKLMASLDIFVLPSYQETFGLVVLEAMASGTAVLATDAGGPPEIIANSSAMFEPRNPQALARTLTHFINSPEERKSLGRELRERACLKFNESHFVHTLIELAEPASSLSAARP